MEPEGRDTGTVSRKSIKEMPCMHVLQILKVRVYFYLPRFLSLAGDPHLQLHHTGKWSAGLWKELGNPKDPRTRLTITDKTEELLHKLWLNMDQNSKAANTNHKIAIPYSACSCTPKE